MYQLDYIRLLAQDFPKSFAFYRDILGFSPLFGTEDDVYAEFATGGTTLALFPRGLMAEVVAAQDQPAAAAAQDTAALVFSVADVDRAYEELGAKGIEFLTPPQDRPDWGIRTIHFRDPDGNLLEIYTSLPASAPPSV